MGWIPTALLFLLATSALAAQREPRTFVRLEAGRAEIHRATSTGAAAGLRVGRALGRRGIVRLELGAGYSPADVGYGAFDAGVELRPLAAGRVTPTLGVGAGFIVEPGFRGETLRATASLEIDLSVRIAVRVGAHAGTHGGERGPHVVFVGIERRGRAR